MKITCIITGTENYLYAIKPVVRRVKAAVYHAKNRRDFEFQFIGMTCSKGEAVMQDALPEGSEVITIDMSEGGTRYKEESQLLIANLQQCGIERSIELGSDLCWSVESDVLVPHNALSCSLDMLEFDDGYYDVAFVTYPSQSGGMFLGGNGSPTNPIAEDFLPEERNVPDELQQKVSELKERMKLFDESTPNEKIQKASEELAKHNEKIKECPPKGNVFELNSKKWRRRGWFDHAHPGVGKGAVLETDWTGMGCTLMSSKALASASFDGYDGKGTQDLFLNWRRWKPNDLRFCVIPHCVCEHVVSANDKDRKVHAFAHHEPLGECRGHLRVQHRPFYKFDGADSYDESNTGKIESKEEGKA